AVGGTSTFGPAGSVIIDGNGGTVEVFGDFPVEVANGGRRRRRTERPAGACRRAGHSQPDTGRPRPVHRGRGPEARTVRASLERRPLGRLTGRASAPVPRPDRRTEPPPTTDPTGVFCRRGLRPPTVCNPNVSRSSHGRFRWPLRASVGSTEARGP